MQLATTKIGEITLVTVGRDAIDADCVDDFKYCVEPIGETGGKVILNLEQVDFVDSVGLDGIIWFQQRLIANNGELRICGAAQSVAKLFEFVKLKKIVATFATQEEAIDSFAGLTAPKPSLAE